MLLLGALAWVLVANVGPLVEMVRISLLDTYPPTPGQPAHYGLGTYATFLHSPIYRNTLLRSLRFAAVTTGLSLVLTYPLAYHVALRVPPERRARRLLLLVAPFWASEIVRIFGIILLLANRGAVNIVLRWAGVTDVPLPLLYNEFSIGFGMLYAMLLSMLLPLYAALDRLPRHLLDAAADLGAGTCRRFVRVTLPLTMGGVVSGCALVFLLSLGVFAEPMLLGRANTTLLAMTIGGLFGNAAGQWPLGAAFSLIMMLAALILCGALVGLLRPRQAGLAV